MERKLVYIASPYAGDVERNVAFARQSCLYCIEKGHTPVAVHLLYPQLLDDNDLVQREVGLTLGLRVLDRCDELWVCGETISSGMAAEIAHAQRNRIPFRQVSREEIGKMEVRETVSC